MVNVPLPLEELVCSSIMINIIRFISAIFAAHIFVHYKLEDCSTRICGYQNSLIVMDVLRERWIWVYSCSPRLKHLSIRDFPLISAPLADRLIRFE